MSFVSNVWILAVCFVLWSFTLPSTAQTVIQEVKSRDAHFMEVILDPRSANVSDVIRLARQVVSESSAYRLVSVYYYTKDPGPSMLPGVSSALKMDTDRQALEIRRVSGKWRSEKIDVYWLLLSKRRSAVHYTLKRLHGRPEDWQLVDHSGSDPMIQLVAGSSAYFLDYRMSDFSMFGCSALKPHRIAVLYTAKKVGISEAENAFKEIQAHSDFGYLTIWLTPISNPVLYPRLPLNTPFLATGPEVESATPGPGAIMCEGFGRLYRCERQ